METLPHELLWTIFEHLSHLDRLSVSATCRTLNASAKPLIFQTLSLHGPPTSEKYRMHIPSYAPKNKVAELADLTPLVNELLGLNILQYIKIFSFSPAIYISTFWDQHRKWVQDIIDTPNNGPYANDIPRNISNGLDDDDEYSLVGIRRLTELRNSRPAREHHLIKKAEAIWNAKIAAQEANADSNLDALIQLFARMPRLRKLQVGSWRCDLSKYKFPASTWEYMDELSPTQYASGRILWTNLQLLASVLQRSQRVMPELELNTLDIDKEATSISHAIEYVFTSVTVLDIYLESHASLFVRKGFSPTLFSRLLSQAAPTLRRLHIKFPTRHCRWNPQPGLAVLDNLLFTSDSSQSTSPSPIIFPALQELRLSSIITTAPSLFAFLSSQPAIRDIDLYFVYIATPGFEWAHLAPWLPRCCRTVLINYCRQNPKHVGNEDDLSSEHFEKFCVWKERLGKNDEWRFIEPTEALERGLRKDVYFKRARLRRKPWYPQLETAMYERVD